MASNTPPKSLEKITSSNHKFTMDIFKILITEKENVFFSPISIQIALILTYIGSKGKTADEMLHALHLPSNKNELLDAMKIFLDQLEKPPLYTATEIFVDQQYKIKNTYKNTAKKYLYSEVQLVDFKSAAEKSREIINSWVAKQTKDKIQNLIPPGLVDMYTKLVLVNAIYFKDEWNKKFCETGTRNAQFFISKDKTVEVPMMQITDYFEYIDKGSFHATIIPYKHSNFKMLILLPKEIDGLSVLEKNLSNIDLSTLLKEFECTKVNLKLPKFKLEKFMDLNKILQNIGMRKMFTNEADLSDIHEPTEQLLKVSNVLQKAFIEVNEQGTEAAAATAVIAKGRSLSFEEIIEFKVDHPFLFFVLENETFLFVGRMVLF